MNSSPLSALRAVIYPAGSLADVERAQPEELQHAGNVSRQVSHSVNPPLLPQQAQRLARPLSVIGHYERVVPGSRALREKARELEARFAGGSLEEIAPEAVRQAVNERLALEGALLLMDPNLGFYEAGELLDSGVERSNVLALRVPGVDITALQTRIEALVNSPETTVPVCQEICTALDKALVDVAKHLEGHEAFYEQTLQALKTSTEQDLNHAGLSSMDEKRKKIEAGHRALTQLTGEYQNAFGQLSHHMLTLVSSALQTAEVTLASLQADAPANGEAIEHVQHWQMLRDQLMHLVAGRNPVDKAAQRIYLDDDVAALDARRKGWFTQFTTAAAEGIAQGTASSALFVLARAYVDPQLNALSFIGQALLSGVAMGALHETIDNFVKPAARELLTSVGMRETEEIPVESLIHDAARATVKDGIYYERSDEEMAAEQALVEQARAGFLNAQNDYKTGTLRGDALTYLNQSVAHMIRQLLSVTTCLDNAEVVTRAVTSFAGGMGMSTTQAWGKMNKTYRHNGRDLPTHVPKAAPQDSLYRRLGKVVNKGLPTIDPRSAEARENYASKIWSASEGMLAYNAVGQTTGRLDIATRAGAAGSVVLANLQALALLLPFYANKQSGSEAKADEGNRLKSAAANVSNPDRSTLAHGTQPGTVGRGAENFYHRVRGLTQLTPQAATLLTEAAIGTIVRFASIHSGTTSHCAIPSPAESPPVVSATPPRLSLGNIQESANLEVVLAILDGAGS